MDKDSILKTYGFYAPFYDFIFGSWVNHGRKKAVEKVEQTPGSRILELGVGTGYSIPLYNRDVHVTGIDISPEMLNVARKRFPAEKYPQVEGFLEMDAQALEFPDNSFDAVIAMYVASVVPDPMKMMQEMSRVCVPGGTVLVLNHFASSKGFLRSIEKFFSPFSKRLGFQPDFSLPQFLETTTIEVEDILPVNLGGYWKLIHFRNEEPEIDAGGGEKTTVGPQPA